MDLSTYQQSHEVSQSPTCTLLVFILTLNNAVRLCGEFLARIARPAPGEELDHQGAIICPGVDTQRFSCLDAVIIFMHILRI